MARNVFYSFHFIPDGWRAAQVRNAGVLEGNQPVDDNDWETIKKKGDDAIRTWIDNQMVGRSCAVVLIGAGTAGRKWINYEIKKAWDSRKGVVGIYIHNLKDRNSEQASKGANPFAGIIGSGRDLSTIVKAIDPPYTTSTNVLAHIKDNLATWVEDAIAIRNKY
ncbi:TIR domain-containing protein [Micromonospora sonneratiae]|uniref:TIR domain-containing protein n=1 Tax=Micromonospora sonneratiae TaxID=1184706 RepID=A0ABW3Y6P7_9ACTN